jgi:hypothetical protein
MVKFLTCRRLRHAREVFLPFIGVQGIEALHYLVVLLVGYYDGTLLAEVSPAIWMSRSRHRSILTGNRHLRSWARTVYYSYRGRSTLLGEPNLVLSFIGIVPLLGSTENG